MPKIPFNQICKQSYENKKVLKKPTTFFKILLPCNTFGIKRAKAYQELNFFTR
jgi:hypothetical protein